VIKSPDFVLPLGFKGSNYPGKLSIRRIGDVYDPKQPIHSLEHKFSKLVFTTYEKQPQAISMSSSSSKQNLYSEMNLKAEMSDTKAPYFRDGQY
jgi:hypothetical protein